MFCTLCVYTTSWQHSCSLRLSLSLSLSLCLSLSLSSPSTGKQQQPWKLHYGVKFFIPDPAKLKDDQSRYWWILGRANKLYMVSNLRNFFPQIKFKLHLIPRTHSIPVRRYSNVWMNHLHVQKVKKAFVCPLLPGIQKLDKHVKYSFSSNKINNRYGINSSLNTWLHLPIIFR